MNPPSGKLFKWVFVLSAYTLSTCIVLRKLLLQPGTIGHNWDWAIPVLPECLEKMSSCFYTWNDASLGEPMSLRFSINTFMALIGGMWQLGIDSSFISKSLPFFTILISGISMFCLLENILREEHKNTGRTDVDRIIFYPSFLGGFFYAFSPFLMFEFIGGAWLEYSSQALIPLIILFFRRAYLFPHSRFSNLTIAAVLLAFASISLHTVIFVYAIIGFYIALQPQRRLLFKNLIVLTILYSLFSSWWLVPTVAQLASVIGTASSQDVLSLNNIRSGAPSLLEALSATGYARPFFKQMLSPDLKPLWALVTYGLICLIFTEILFFRKTREGLFWLCLFTVSLIFATAGNPPLSQCVTWMYENIFLMRMFRSPQAISVVPVLSLAILVGIASASFLRRNLDILSRPYKKYGFYTATLTSLIIWFNPFFIQGDLGMSVLKEEHKYFDHIDVYNVPPSYQKIFSQINKDKDDFRVLFLPMVASPRYLKTEYQSTAHGLDPSVYYSPHSGVFADLMADGLSRRFINLLDKSFTKRVNGENTLEIDKLLNLVNTRFVLLRKDVLPHYSYSKDTWRYQRVKQYLRGSETFQFLQDTDYVDLFLNKSFLPHIYAASSLSVIAGGMNSLPPLTYTSYLDDRPSIALTEDQDSYAFLSLFHSKRQSDNGPQSAIGPSVILANKSLNDLLIHWVITNSFKEGSWSAANRQTAMMAEMNFRGKWSLLADEDGDYEVWIKETCLPSAIRGQEFLSIGELQFPLPCVDVGNIMAVLINQDKWVKVADIKLQDGKYGVSISNSEGEPLKSMYFPQILIVPKGLCDEFANTMSDKPLSYLFYLETDKAKKLAQVKDTSAVKTKEDPFSLPTKQFYLPKDGDYTVKAFIKPKRVFVPDGIPITALTARGRVSLDAIKGWKIHAKKMHYEQSFSEEGMHIKTYFSRSSKVAEEIVLTKEFSHTKLIDNPYLVFSYLTEDPKVQEVWLNVSFKDEKGNTLPEPIYLHPNDKLYRFDLYEEAKRIFGKRPAKHLYIGEIEIIYGKRTTRSKQFWLWFKKVKMVTKKSLDATSDSVRGYYTFTFKNLAFLDYPPVIATFDNLLRDYKSTSHIHYYLETGALAKARFFEELPFYVKSAYRRNEQCFVDLKEEPVLCVSFPTPTYSKIRDRRFPKKFRVSLVLDFHGDKQPDAEVELFLPAIPKNGGYSYIKVPAHDEVKKRFPDESHYNLLSLSVSHPDARFAFYQDLTHEKLETYKERIYSPSDFKIGADVLRIDGKMYKLPEDYKKYERNAVCRIEYMDVALKEGSHTLEVLDNENFKVEIVEIQPATSGQMVTSSQAPRTNFRKINPTRYIVDVKGAKGSFVLVFNESYHGGWKAYIRNKPGFKGRGPETDHNTVETWSALWNLWKDRKDRIDITEHFVANQYANGWIIPSMQELGFRDQESGGKENKNTEGVDLQIVLEYKPQMFFEIGGLLSAITLLGCIAYLGYGGARRRKSIASRN